MSNRSKSLLNSTLKSKLKQNPANIIFSTLRKSSMSVQASAFFAIRDHEDGKKMWIGGKRRENVGLQFINHCATLVQTHFRGYIQQKKYRQFLPIYRRFREILFAGFEGWKMRKIMNLQPIKAQIKAIRDKTKSSLMNMARIAKRELLDDIERLKKKGRWVEVLHQSKKIKNSICRQFSKENVSLYGNVKSKSIKNIFRESSNKKEDKNIQSMKKNMESSLQMKVQSSREKLLQRQTPQLSNRRNPQSFDQIQVKGHKDFYALLQQKCQMSIELFENPKKTKRPPVKSKRGQRQESQKEKRESKTSTQVCSQECFLESSYASRDEKQSIIDKYSISDLKSPSIDKKSLKSSKLSKSKKIKITLAKSQDKEDGLLPFSRQREEITDKKIDEDFLPKQLKKMKDKYKSSSLSCLSELIKLHNDVYLRKKQELTHKIRNLFDGQDNIDDIYH